MDKNAYLELIELAITDCAGYLALELPWMKEERIDQMARHIVEGTLELALDEMEMGAWLDYVAHPAVDETLSRVEAAEKDILNLKKTILDLAGRLDNVSKYARVPLDHHATSSHFNERYNGLANPWHDYGKKY